MLKEYKIINNIVADTLEDGDFVVRDININPADGETLVYDTATKRIKSVVIPPMFFWNGIEVEKDFNYIEEQKKFKFQKILREDVKKASLAYVANQNGWCDMYNHEEVDDWIKYLQSKAKGIKITTPPHRPDVLKYF